MKHLDPLASTVEIVKSTSVQYVFQMQLYVMIYMCVGVCVCVCVCH